MQPKFSLKTIVFTLLVTIQCCSSVFAQTIHKISIVDGSTMSPMPTVNLYPIVDIRSGYSSDFNGDIELLQSDLAKFDLWEVSFIGYEKVQYTSKWLLANTTIILIEDNQLLANVEIRAERLVAEEFKLEKINQLQIYQNPTSKADPILAVNNMPASTTTDESANISLRGSSALETGIMLDNVPIYNAVKFAQLNGIGTFSIFNTAIVENVNVFAGNPPLEFGNVSSGLIAIETQNGIPEFKSTSAIVSMASFGISHSQPIGKKAAFSIFSNYQPSTFIRAINTEALAELNDFSSLDIGVQFRYAPNSKLKLKSITYGLEESYNFAFRAPSFQGDFVQNTARMFNVSSVAYQFSDHHRLSINSGVSISQSDFSFSKFEFDRPRNDHYVSINHLYSKQNSDLKFGITYDIQQLELEAIAPHHSYALRQEHPSDSFSFDVSIKIPEAYIYHKRRLSDRLVLGSGLRKSLARVEGKDYLSRQFNLFYRSKKSFEMIFGHGIYHRSIVNNQSWQVIQFRSRQLSADLKWDFDRVEAQFSVYYKNTTADQSVRQLVGTELFAQTKKAGIFSAETSFTWLQPIGKNSPNNTSIWGEQVNYFLRATVQADFGNGWTSSANILYREGSGFDEVVTSEFVPEIDVYRPTLVHQGGKHENYKNVSWNLSKLHPISEHFTAIYFCSINNVFNFENVRQIIHNFDYSTTESSFFSKRLFYVGVSLNF